MKIPTEYNYNDFQNLVSAEVKKLKHGELKAMCIAKGINYATVTNCLSDKKKQYPTTLLDIAALVNIKAKVEKVIQYHYHLSDIENEQPKNRPTTKRNRKVKAGD